MTFAPLVPRGRCVADSLIQSAGGDGEETEGLCGLSPPLLSALGPQSFHFPLFMTMLHLAVIFLFSALSRALVQCSSHRARVVLSWTDYLRRVAPTGRSNSRVAAGVPRPESREALGALRTHPTCPSFLLNPLPLLQLSEAGSIPVLASHMGLRGFHQAQNRGASPCGHAGLG